MIATDLALSVNLSFFHGFRHWKWRVDHHIDWITAAAEQVVRSDLDCSSRVHLTSECPRKKGRLPTPSV